MIEDRIRELYQLRNENPRAALQMAETLGPSTNERVAASVVFIDCGDALDDVVTVSRGVDILCELHGTIEFTPDLLYNLANGLQVRARLTYGPVSLVRGQATVDRFEARVNFGNVMHGSAASPELKSQMSTNIGILLLETHRWVEAIDFFQDARRLLPRNGVAGFQEMRRLMALAGLFSRETQTYQSYCHLDSLIQRIRYLATVITENLETVEEFAGKSVLPAVRKYVDEAMKVPEGRDVKIEEDYFRFIRDKNLALSVHCGASEFNSRKFDLLSIPSIQTTLADGHDVPEVFAMMNVMKADFAFARQLFYDVRELDAETPFFETTSHGDTLNYALFGVRYSALTVAQRVAFDILDKIAVALACYIGTDKAHKKTFADLWGKTGKGGFLVLDEKIDDELRRGNGGLIALFNMFHDISNDEKRGRGFMELYKSFRNSSTHRFTVLHDMGAHKGPSSSRSVEHQRIEDFLQLTLSSIRMARAALFYFVDTIVFIESRKRVDEALVVLSSEVPDHDYIRGRG